MFSFKKKTHVSIKNFIKYLFLPFDLDEEEDRELTAIKGYNNEYKKNLAFYFKNYSNEVKQKISKIKLIRLLRDIGFDRERIQFNEINILIRLMFKYNLSEFDFNQFINLLVQIAYILYYKFKPSLTIGEAYGNFIRRLAVDKINEHQIEFLNQKEFIIKARKIIGSDVITLFLAYNIGHLDWIKNYSNALFY